MWDDPTTTPEKIQNYKLMRRINDNQELKVIDTKNFNFGIFLILTYLLHFWEFRSILNQII